MRCGKHGRFSYFLVMISSSLASSPPASDSNRLSFVSAPSLAGWQPPHHGFHSTSPLFLAGLEVLVWSQIGLCLVLGFAIWGMEDEDPVFAPFSLQTPFLLLSYSLIRCYHNAISHWLTLLQNTLLLTGQKSLN